MQQHIKSIEPNLLYLLYGKHQRYVTRQGLIKTQTH